jgi:uncharacterized protein
VRTDIVGFVGIAERGPLPEDCPPGRFDPAKIALKIGKWAEFQAHFGGLREYGYLAYAVRAFFENGGATCYVVRVAATTAADPSRNAAKAAIVLPSGPAVAIGKIAQVIGPFQFKPTLDAGAVLDTGDSLLVSGGGVTQLVHVAGLLADGSPLLSAALGSQIAAGASVSRFPAGCRISAASRGNWGNTVRIQIAVIDANTVSLRATVDLGPNQPAAEDEWYQALSLTDPAAYNYAPTVLAQQSNLVRLEQLGAGPIDLSAAAALAGGSFHLQGGRDGLAAITLQDFSGGPDDLRGLRLLEEIDDVAVIAVPDAVFQIAPAMKLAAPVADPCMPPVASLPDPVAADPTAVTAPLSAQDSIQLQARMLDQCVRLQYRVALIDPPGGQQIGQVQNWAQTNGLVGSPAARFAALYYPWLDVPDALELAGNSRSIPPSGHVAGAYAQNDLTFGVQKPPANIELQFVVDVEKAICDRQQQLLNLNNVNAIRAFPGRGIRVWGARSLAPVTDSDWRFIHVRRLMSAIEETVQRASRWTVFQSNDRALRSSLTHSLNVLLEEIWARGGLKGAKPADAFYVICDDSNNPQTVVDQGKLICEVGVAIAAPMEFLVFEIRQDASGSQVLEN